MFYGFLTFFARLRSTVFTWYAVRLGCFPSNNDAIPVICGAAKLGKKPEGIKFMGGWGSLHDVI